MFPSAFEYSAPTSLEEALSLLKDVGDEGRVLAGGQSLIPMMKLRLAMPGHLVDINGVTELDYIRDVNGHVAVGALTRHAQVASSDLLSATNHTVAACAPWVADPLVRNRGTMAGSIAHCDPEGDWNSVMLAIGASVVARSADGSERVIHITDFLVDFFTNSLQPGEMVTEIRIPKYTGRGGGAYLKVTEAEQMMIGQQPSDELFAEAGAIAARTCEPEDNVRGPADYKRAVVAEYTKRAFATALAQANGGQ